MLQVAGVFAAVGLIVQLKFTVPEYPFIPSTLMVDVFPVVAPGLTVIAPSLPAELLRARPKRLRFLIINTAGRLVQHARKTLLRLAALVDRIALWRVVMRLLPITT